MHLLMVMKITIGELRKLIGEEVFRAYANSAGFCGGLGISASPKGGADMDVLLGDEEAQEEQKEDDVKEERPDQFTARVRSRKQPERPRRSH